MQAQHVALESLEARRLLAASIVHDAAGLLPADAVTAGGLSYFFANDGRTGKEIWASDGTTAGTRLVKDLSPGAASSTPDGLFTLGDKAVFLTRQNRYFADGKQSMNYTLWSTDGTDAGTTPLVTFRGVFWVHSAHAGDKLYIAANDFNEKQSYWWVSDGTAEGTQQLKMFDRPSPEAGAPIIDRIAATQTGRCLVGMPGAIWASDGTLQGTISMESALWQMQAPWQHPYYIILSYAQLAGGEDRFVITGEPASYIWLSDGTEAGTTFYTSDAIGSAEGYQRVILNNKLCYITSGSDGDNIVKTVQAIDLQTGDAETLFTTTGDGSDAVVDLYHVGDRLLINLTLNERTRQQVLLSDGTAAGTRTIYTSEQPKRSFAGFTEVEGQVYFVVRDDDLTMDGIEDGVWPAIAYELWTTDGTADGTARVSTLARGPFGRTHWNFSLRQANGKLAVRKMVGQILPSGRIVPIEEGGTDLTTVYDPRELTIGREAVTARLIGGVLRINGSLHDDNVAVFRLRTDHDVLVVQYNGNQRRFAFGDVRRIVVDLQDGSDRFEIIEGDRPLIRLRTSITGGDGNDTIIAASAPDTIIGGEGNDRLYGGRGDDQISGGAGNDRINGGTGADRIGGGEGRDRIVAGREVDVLFGLNAIEYAFGREAEGEDFAHNILVS